MIRRSIARHFRHPISRLYLPTMPRRDAEASAFDDTGRHARSRKCQFRRHYLIAAATACRHAMKRVLQR